MSRNPRLGLRDRRLESARVVPRHRRERLERMRLDATARAPLLRHALLPPLLLDSMTRLSDRQSCRSIRRLLALNLAKLGAAVVAASASADGAHPLAADRGVLARVADVSRLDGVAQSLGGRVGRVSKLPLEDGDDVRRDGCANGVAVLRGEGRVEWSSVLHVVVRLERVAELARLDNGAHVIDAERADLLEAAAVADVAGDALKALVLAIVPLRVAARRLNLVGVDAFGRV